MPSGNEAMLGWAVFSLNSDRAWWSWGREVGVVRGMARKCVRRGGEGFGGIVVYVCGCMCFLFCFQTGTCCLENVVVMIP